jgi:hypothetical protein
MAGLSMSRSGAPAESYQDSLLKVAKVTSTRPGISRRGRPASS